ncbi:MAG: hypothetical protein ACHQET_12965, partial [Chitinophagales bacterium]
MIFSLLVSLTIYFRKEAQLYLKIFPVFLFITIVSEELAFYEASQGRSNISVYNIYSVLAICFYFFIFYQIISNKKIKKFVLISMICYPLISIWNIVYI